jgi:predicted alpha/beta superfamily hydrolase
MIFEHVTIRFEISSLPSYTPLESEFYLETGWDGWNPANPKQKMVLEGSAYQLELAIPLGMLLEYKITRGSSEREEGNAYGHRRIPHRLVVQESCRQQIEVEGWMDLPQGAMPPLPHTRVGSLESFELYSPQLEDTFTFWVYRPPSYDRSSEPYPVMYFHDGRNIFDAQRSFAGVSWEADAAAEALALEGMETLMVAVDVREEHRNQDYVPFKAAFNGYTTHADAYGDFLTQTLKPYIDSHFRTRLETEHTAIVGASFGGLISLYLGLKHPEIYGFIGAFSPSVLVADGQLFGYLYSQPLERQQRWYLDMGTLEGSDTVMANYFAHATKTFAYMLEKRGQTVRLEIGEGHWHDEQAWKTRFPKALRFFLDAPSEA